MTTVFLGANGIGLVKILTEGQKVTSDYFKKEVLCDIYRAAHGDWTV
jgi:hypothetical protein